MSVCIIVLSSGPFVYWLMRLWLLAFGADQTMTDTLETDYALARRARITFADSRIG